MLHFFVEIGLFIGIFIGETDFIEVSNVYFDLERGPVHNRLIFIDLFYLFHGLIWLRILQNFQISSLSGYIISAVRMSVMIGLSILLIASGLLGTPFLSNAFFGFLLCENYPISLDIVWSK